MASVARSIKSQRTVLQPVVAPVDAVDDVQGRDDISQARLTGSHQDRTDLASVVKAKGIRLRRIPNEIVITITIARFMSDLDRR